MLWQRTTHSHSGTSNTDSPLVLWMDACSVWHREACTFPDFSFVAPSVILKRKRFRVDVKMCVLKRVCSCHLIWVYLEVLFSAILCLFWIQLCRVPVCATLPGRGHFIFLHRAQSGAGRNAQIQANTKCCAHQNAKVTPNSSQASETRASQFGCMVFLKTEGGRARWRKKKRII